MIFLKPKKIIYLGRYDISFGRPRISQRNGLSQIRRKLAQKPELLLCRISLHLLCFEGLPRLNKARQARLHLGLPISTLNICQSRSSPRNFLASEALNCKFQRLAGALAEAGYSDCFKVLSIFRLDSLSLRRSRLSYFFNPRARLKASFTKAPLV